MATNHYAPGVLVPDITVLTEAQWMEKRRNRRMFGKIGTGELLIVLIVALVIFGPAKLPALGKMAGTKPQMLRMNPALSGVSSSASALITGSICSKGL